MRMRNRLETRVARDGYRVCPKDRNGTFRALRPDGVALPKTPREASGRAARKGSKTRRGTFSITGAEAFGKPGIPNGQEMIWSGENPKRGRCRTRRGRAARKSAEPSYGKARRRLQKRGSAWRLREGTDRVGGARPAVKQRASNGCRPNDRFWACVVNRTHLGRIPCGKRSEDGALLSWTHDPDADSGSRDDSGGESGAQDPPRVSSTKTRPAFLRIRIPGIKTKKRQSGARFGRFDDCEPENSSPVWRRMRSCQIEHCVHPKTRHENGL